MNDYAHCFAMDEGYDGCIAIGKHGNLNSRIVAVDQGDIS